MIRYLLDTNICIYLIKKHPPEVLARFQQIKLTQLYIPTISVFELYYGIEKNNSHERNLNALEFFIAPLTIIDFTIDAAIALAFDMVLLTNNTREFERVKNLKLENWII
jgi:tRNA(fMet)-specific endonuclease VapC